MYRTQGARTVSDVLQRQIGSKWLIVNLNNKITITPKFYKIKKILRSNGNFNYLN